MTVARLIADDPQKIRFYPAKKRYLHWKKPKARMRRPRKPQGWKATYPGECLAFDTIVFHVNGSRRYITSCIDIFSRAGFAYVTTSMSSAAASRFFR